MSKIILASASPRRKELMELAGYDFEVICADIVEVVPEEAMPQEVVMSLALQKAQAVAAEHKEAVVIGSDTVVALDGKILGKPHSEQEACEMLRSLSGRTHKVFTGVAIVCGGKVKNFFDETDVEFYSLGDDEIKKYVQPENRRTRQELTEFKAKARCLSKESMAISSALWDCRLLNYIGR